MTGPRAIWPAEPDATVAADGCIEHTWQIGDLEVVVTVTDDGETTAVLCGPKDTATVIVLDASQVKPLARALFWATLPENTHQLAPQHPQRYGGEHGGGHQDPGEPTPARA